MKKSALVVLVAAIGLVLVAPATALTNIPARAQIAKKKCKKHKRKCKKHKKHKKHKTPAPAPTLSLAQLQQIATEDARQGSTQAGNVIDYGANDCHLRSTQQGDCAAGFHWVPVPGYIGVCSWRVTVATNAARQILVSRSNVACGSYPA
ncbi:MAG: hypothetical protein WBV53_01325 [Solirubrobacterales bacterium]